MVFDIVLFGELVMPNDAVEPWLAEPSSVRLPWPESVVGAPKAPEAVLAQLEGLTCAPHEIVDVRLERHVVTVACFVGNENFIEVRDALGRLFVSAAPHQATGSLSLIGFRGLLLGERLELGFGRTRLRPLRLSERLQATQDPTFVALEAAIHERFDSLVGRIGPRDEQSPFVVPRASWR